jgi:hypothetical protein
MQPRGLSAKVWKPDVDKKRTTYRYSKGTGRRTRTSLLTRCRHWRQARKDKNAYCYSKGTERKQNGDLSV